MTKPELRKLYATELLAANADELERSNQLLGKHLLYLIHDKGLKHICCYQPLTKLREPDITPVISHLAHSPEIMLTIIHPRADTPLPQGSFDLIIAPMLAFDSAGNRLGRGGGWYDKFIASQPQALNIGVAYALQQADNIPTEPHDQKLDYIVTEQGIINIET